MHNRFSSNVRRSSRALGRLLLLLSASQGNLSAYQKAYELAQRSLELERAGDIEGSTLAYLQS